MPRREDERRLNLSSTHPPACTCKNCTDNFLNKKGMKSANKRKKSKAKAGELVKSHPADCKCASCALLKSMDHSEPESNSNPGFVKKLFGKR